MESTSKEQKDRDDVKSAFAQLESAAEHMQLDSNTTQEPSAKDHHAPTTAKVETTYSTRGRPQEDSLEAAGDLLSIAKELGDQPIRVRESFLSDSLTEKEIRTRTRVLPNLDGMNSLRKGEIKSDLAIARGDKPLGNKKRKGRDDDTADDATMDTTDEDPSVYRTVEVGTLTFGVPSNTFVPPTVPPALKRPSPRQVDSIVAYNPPRPPESIGAKKEHRLRNWERRPEVIESGLRKYRTTVQKISDELRITEVELETATAVDNILRRHFFCHIHNLNQEISAIQEEMTMIQQECLDLCGGTGGRTRTRGSVKAGSVMRDILQALNSKGQGMMECEASQESNDPVPIQGDGGLRLENFHDWDRSTTFPKSDLAATWLSPQVSTPYGVGTVKSTVLATVHLPPRVKVCFPFGVGYFGFDSLKQVMVETPSSMTDDQLADRWNRLVSRAKAFGSVIDTVGMTSRHIQQSSQDDQDDATIDESTDTSSATDALLPFGSNVLPTGLGRGATSYKSSYEELSKETRKLLQEGQDVLGVKSNTGVRSSLLAAEDQQGKKLQLKARCLHLRNLLIRQHRTRILNEKTFAATKERAGKVESLVDEMRSDLKSLKGKLDAEMREIGISEPKAESILTKYYDSLDSLHQGDASPPKRQRRSLPMGEMTAEDNEPVAADPTDLGEQ